MTETDTNIQNVRESHISIFVSYVIMKLAGGGLLLMIKIMAIANFKVYVLLQPICAGEESVVIVIDNCVFLSCYIGVLE